MRGAKSCSDKVGDDGVGDEEMTFRDAKAGACRDGTEAIARRQDLAGIRHRHQMVEGEGAGEGGGSAVRPEVCCRHSVRCPETKHDTLHDQLVRSQRLRTHDRSEVP